MIVLQTAKREHLGFLLLAANGGDQADCIFMVLPQNPALLESPTAQALFARKSLGESKASIINSFPLHLVISSPGLPQLVVEFAESGDGTWREEEPGAASGVANLPPAA
jgi:hypothetical protein